MSKLFYAQISNVALIILLLSSNSLYSENKLISKINKSKESSFMNIKSNSVFLQTGSKVEINSQTAKSGVLNNENNRIFKHKEKTQENQKEKTKNQSQSQEPQLLQIKNGNLKINDKTNKLRNKVSLNQDLPINSTNSTSNIESNQTQTFEETQKNGTENIVSNNTSNPQAEFTKEVNENLNSRDYNNTSPLSLFINEEISIYFSNSTNFKGSCKTYIETNLQHSVTSKLLNFDSENSLKEFEEYINNCIEIYSKIDHSVIKMKETLKDFSEKIDKEIKEFETQYPPTIGDSLLDFFFSFNYFKKNMFKALMGNTSEDNIAEEYEKDVFKNKRLDALIKISFENLLYDLHNKYDNFYNNNQNKLKSKVPLENMQFIEVVKTKEYKTWSSSFVSEHHEYKIDVETLSLRLSILFSSIVNDFKTKFLAQETHRRSLNFAVNY